jgi:hypothetical protein
MALAFVQCDLIIPTFHQIRNAAPAALQPLFTYFEQQWLVNVPLQLWNVCDVDIRTNNGCEGWHNRFNRAVDKHHPNIWHLLHCIKEEQASTEVTIFQISSGQDVLREVPKYKTIKKRIQNLRDRYRSGTIDVMSFVDGVSHNIKT